MNGVLGWAVDNSHSGYMRSRTRPRGLRFGFVGCGIVRRIAQSRGGFVVGEGNKGAVGNGDNYMVCS